MSKKPKGVVFSIRVTKEVKQWIRLEAEQACSSENAVVVRTLRDRMASERRARAVERT
jgi:predicted HicB family RNase H-like nuclease